MLIRRTRRTRIAGSLLLGLATLALLGCGSSEGKVTTAIRPAPPLPLGVDVAPAHAAEHSTIQIEAEGLAPSSSIAIGFGPASFNYRIIDTIRTDASGRLKATVQVPDWAQRGKEYVVTVGLERGPAVAVSSPIIVASTGASLTLRGRYVDLGLDCPALRSEAGKVYALALPMMLVFPPGTPLQVKGTIAPNALCASATTIEVKRISRIE